MALNDPVQYSEKLLAHHAEIAAFGGMFLLLVFLNFLFDDGKDTHWFHWLESRLANLANVPAMSVFANDRPSHYGGFCCARDEIGGGDCRHLGYCGLCGCSGTWAFT